MRVKCANCGMVYDIDPTPMDFRTEQERRSTATCPGCHSNAKDTTEPPRQWKNAAWIILLCLILGGCVHVKQGEFEYWRFGEQTIGEALLTLPDGSELLLDGQKSELPKVEITATSITIGGKKVKL